MVLHPKTFDYLQPTLEQVKLMQQLRFATMTYAALVDTIVPDGPDKTYLMRKLREVAMWINVAITRHPDGTPRTDNTPDVREYPADHPVEGDLGSVPL